MEIAGAGQNLNQLNGLENRSLEKRTETERAEQIDQLEQQTTQQNAGNSERPEPIENPAATLVAPSESTIQQLDSSNAARTENNNANGLGEVATNSYQSLARTEEIQQLSEKINVDITV